MRKTEILQLKSAIENLIIISKNFTLLKQNGFSFSYDDNSNLYEKSLVLNEVFHKLMISEIAETQGIEAYNAAKLIKRDPEIIRDLRRIWEEMELLSVFGIALLNTTTYPEFVRLSREYQLSAADAAHIAAMQSNGIISMASNDRDFKRVSWLKLWRPEIYSS